MPETNYTREFFEVLRGGAERSALVIVPLVIQMLQVKTVVDIGCGDGSWLAVFRELGIVDTVGLDGEYVDRRMLRIPQDQFIPTDLSLPFQLPRTFDLAVSLEVAEHLPPQAAESFVRSLTQLAPAVLFSAAIPSQGGIDHLNEQWPDYWASLFKSHDYLPIDCIRGKIWANSEVDYWYAQNTLLFASAARIQEDPVLLRELNSTNPRQLAMVHPRKFTQPAHSRMPVGVRAAFGLLVRAMWNTARRSMPNGLRGNYHSN